MITKEQNISTNTLLAAAIGCFMQLAFGILVIISPFLFDHIIVPLFGQKASINYFMALSTPFIKAPIMFTIGLIFLLAISFLYLFASKKIQKNSKIQMWSTIGLIISFLLFHFGIGFLSIAAILGFIGSITGLMHNAQTKK